MCRRTLAPRSHHTEASGQRVTLIVTLTSVFNVSRSVYWSVPHVHIHTRSFTMLNALGFASSKYWTTSPAAPSVSAAAVLHCCPMDIDNACACRLGKSHMNSKCSYSFHMARAKLWLTDWNIGLIIMRWSWVQIPTCSSPCCWNP